MATKRETSNWMLRDGSERQAGKVRTLGFGIYGAGAIGREFALALRSAERCRLVHVCSRREEAAHALARDFGAPRWSCRLDELLADPRVDAVYVATPHPSHEEPTLSALAAGKHVLCEKPLAPSPEAARRMLDAAAQHGRLLLEAYMYRHHPLMLDVAECIRQNAIGRVLHVDARFGFEAPRVAGSRLYEPSLAGGAIWDVGGYPLSFASFVAGLVDGRAFSLPARAEWSARLGPTGVDEWAHGKLSFSSGLRADVTVSISQALGTRTVISGELGHIELDNPWIPGGVWQGTRSAWALTPAGGQGARREVAARSVYALEADAFAEATRTMAPAWPVMDAPESRALAQLLGEWRAHAS